MSQLPPIVSFVARSGTGKTTFLCKLIPALRARGVRMMVVKHDVHGFEVDKPGKDTWRLRQAGAQRVVIANAEQIAVMGRSDGEQPLLSLVARHGADVDLVLTEGYRRSGMPKVLIARSGAPQPFNPGPEELAEAIAVVTDVPVGLELPELPLNDAEPVADWLLSEFLPPDRIDRALTGVVLAGTDADAAIARSIAGRLLPHCAGGVLVVASAGTAPPADLPAGATVVNDLLPEHAALGGLYTGLALARTPFVFLVSCGMPNLDADLVAWMKTLPPARADVLLPVADGREQPTHAVYGHRCLGAMKEALLSGELAMGLWYGSVRVERITQETWQAVHPAGTSFRRRGV
ncbi:MAG: molybdopterin-guanine dinucleotide biosynthesis protein B [Proteobacteria bacterium]|nr:molybdopterin-guanine dinucleotide biosynthesis protein B [Pseudomonadota bacterium]